MYVRGDDINGGVGVWWVTVTSLASAFFTFTSAQNIALHLAKSFSVHMLETNLTKINLS